LNLTLKEYDRIKKSVHFHRFSLLVLEQGLSSEQLLAIHELIDDIKGYGSLKNACGAQEVVDLIVAGIDGSLLVDGKPYVF